jgi:hypothetical protein
VIECEVSSAIEVAFGAMRIDTFTLWAAAQRDGRKGSTFVPPVKMRTRIVDELIAEFTRLMTLARGRNEAVGGEAHWRLGLKSVW